MSHETVSAKGRSPVSDSRSRSEFERLFLPHLDRAYALARWLVRQPADAEDMVQEAYLKAFNSFPSYAGGDSRAYLLTIVRNTCFNRLRRQKAERNVIALRPGQGLEEDGDDSVENIADPELGPEETLVARRERVRVREAIFALPEPFREVVVLRELEELSYAEIAAITRMPVGTVMSRLSRARSRLRELLQEKPETGGERHGMS
jgi:RNA polymerase sigma-70 factor (ECF subfamily)